MASRRNLKKDIDYLTYEVITDCYAYMHINPKKNQDKVFEIIGNTVEMRNELFSRVNNQDKGDKKLIKDYYRNIYKELLVKVDASFTNLSELTK